MSAEIYAKLESELRFTSRELGALYGGVRSTLDLHAGDATFTLALRKYDDEWALCVTTATATANQQWRPVWACSRIMQIATVKGLALFADMLQAEQQQIDGDIVHALDQIRAYNERFR